MLTHSPIMFIHFIILEILIIHKIWNSLWHAYIHRLPWIHANTFTILGFGCHRLRYGNLSRLRISAVLPCRRKMTFVCLPPQCCMRYETVYPIFMQNTGKLSCTVLGGDFWWKMWQISACLKPEAQKWSWWRP